MAILYRYGGTDPVIFVIEDTSGNGVTGHTFSAGEVYVSGDGGAWTDVSSQCSEYTGGTSPVTGRGWYKWIPSTGTLTQHEQIVITFADGVNKENRIKLLTGGNSNAYFNGT